MMENKKGLQSNLGNNAHFIATVLSQVADDKALSWLAFRLHEEKVTLKKLSNQELVDWLYNEKQQTYGLTEVEHMLIKPFYGTGCIVNWESGCGDTDMITIKRHNETLCQFNKEVIPFDRLNVYSKTSLDEIIDNHYIVKVEEADND